MRDQLLAEKVPSHGPGMTQREAVQGSNFLETYATELSVKHGPRICQFVLQFINEESSKIAAYTKRSQATIADEIARSYTSLGDEALEHFWLEAVLREPQYQQKIHQVKADGAAHGVSESKNVHLEELGRKLEITTETIRLLTEKLHFQDRLAIARATDAT